MNYTDEQVARAWIFDKFDLVPDLPPDQKHPVPIELIRGRFTGEEISILSTGRGFSEPICSDLLDRFEKAISLLPCPFCGGKPELHDFDLDNPDLLHTSWGVFCSECPGEVGYEKGCLESPIDAVKAWNRRSEKKETTSKFIGDITEKEIKCGDFRVKFRVEPYDDKFRAFFLGKAIGNKYFIGNTPEEAIEKANTSLRVEMSFE